MRHPAYQQLPDEVLEPTYTPPGIESAAQRAHLRELRELQNAIPAAQFTRDDRMTALALSGAVSRRDMARACGLNKSRVDQIVAAHSGRLQCARQTRARELEARRRPLDSVGSVRSGGQDIYGVESV
jgi:hypothetical protein